MSVEVFYTAHEHPQLHATKPPGPSVRCILRYLAEGGANFVFHILPRTSDDALPPALEGRVLRLRKDLPHVQSAKEQAEAFQRHFEPLFAPQHLVQPELIALGDGFSSLVNASLATLERSAGRDTHSLSRHETYALLLADMTFNAPCTGFQMKPKWLAPSPSAPHGAKRCRTCALRASRVAHQRSTPTDAQAFCPLMLVSDDPRDRETAAKMVTSCPVLQRFLTYDASSLFSTLREGQTTFDPRGVLALTADASAVNELCKAMTLRDCTLFARHTSHGPVEARLADLDLKQPAKLPQWAKIEQTLTEQGWYTNEEDPQHWSRELMCQLSRGVKGV
ncbi:inositol-pentakisphosphate 2-kinase [Neohortaea acidophila]|uniref:Inositol-pentakisphosphate 2-kinase n=1 Tax=Neohortaea acidophila TaxID=245834 RepID=A0A6A6PS09_9PEZI|nr:inositol-pentakisphosphate 2-kinase [Neohortaea acidophila]KAF2482665.1 inositol-pentakisphosphate 2-kinase [Neohortaea acidophila]